MKLKRHLILFLILLLPFNIPILNAQKNGKADKDSPRTDKDSPRTDKKEMPRGNIKEGTDLFIAVGSPVRKNHGAIITSKDGKEWQEVFRSKLNTFKGIAYGQDKLVAVGDKKIFLSEDLKTWKMVLDISNVDRFKDGLEGVAFGDDLFIAVGKRSYLYYSEDGVKWTKYSGDPIDSKSKPVLTDLYGINYFDGKFYAYGNKSRILTMVRAEKDGIVIESNINHDSGYTVLKEMAFGNGNYVVVGTRKDFVSNDGKTWKNVTQTKKLDWQNWGIAYGNGKFVIVCRYGRIFVSESGEQGSWKEAFNRRSVPFNDVVFSGSKFLAVGPRGILAISDDGDKWEKIAVPPDDKFRLYRMKKLLYIP